MLRLTFPRGNRRESENADEILEDFRWASSRESHNRDGGETILEDMQVLVVWPEVVPVA